MKRTSEIDMTGWNLIGYVGVDSGQMMVGDPCYLDKWGGTEFTSPPGAAGKHVPTGEYSYDGACTATCSEGSVGVLGNGLAAVSPTGFGDGQYGVYVKWSDEGAWGPRAAAMMVVFIDNEGDGAEDYNCEDYTCDECGDEIGGFGGDLCAVCEDEQTCDCGNEKDPVWAQCEECDERDSEAEKVDA
jgi:hypothetical protein